MRMRGFTLIEVMIVIAIFSLIILVAAPLSGGWVRDADLLTTESQLTEAVGRAKAASLRNASAATGENPAAVVCRSNTNLLTVIEGTSAVAPSCTPTGTQVWQAQMNSKVTVQVNSTAFNCLCFNNKGAVTTTAPCNACAASTSFSLDAGGSHTSNVAVY